MRRLGDKLLRGYTAFVFAFIYAPILVLVVFSFNASRLISTWGGFTLKWYEQLVLSGQLGFGVERIGNIWEAMFNSVWVAGATAVLSAVLGTFAAYAMSRFNIRLRNYLEGFYYVPIIIPEIAEALSIFIFLIFIGFPLSGWSVVIGHVAFATSFVYVILMARFAGFDKSLEEAAKTLGANEIQTFLRVTLPLVFPGILAGSLLAFTLSFDNFVKTAFTRGPGFQTLPIVIFNEARRGGVSNVLNALATLTLLVSLIVVFLRLRLQRRLR